MTLLPPAQGLQQHQQHLVQLQKAAGRLMEHRQEHLLCPAMLLMKGAAETVQLQQQVLVQKELLLPRQLWMAEFLVWTLCLFCWLPFGETYAKTVL